MTEQEWRWIDLQLSEMRDLLTVMRLESKEEAIGKKVSRPGGKGSLWFDTAPRWFDDAVGMDVKAWLLIPYNDGIDQETLIDLIEKGKDLLKPVEQAIASREFTPRLLRLWGALSSIIGALNLIYQSEGRVGGARAGAAGGGETLDDHRRWFSHYLLQWIEHHRTADGRGYERGAVNRVRDDIEALINKIVDGEIELEQWEDVWFHRFLSRKANKLTRVVTREFREEISVEKARTILSAEFHGRLPPLDLPRPGVPLP